MVVNSVFNMAEVCVTLQLMKKTVTVLMVVNYSARNQRSLISMKRGSSRFRKDSANKRSQRCARDSAVVSYWNDQKVVPTKVNGKRTYVIISTGPPSAEYDRRGYGMKERELFPSEVERHDTLDSHLCCRTACRSSTVHTMTSDSTTDIVNGKSHGSDSREGHNEDRRRSVTGSNSLNGSSVINLAQSCEEQMTTTEKPSTVLDEDDDDLGGTTICNSSTSRRHSSHIRKQSAVDVRQCLISGEYRPEASTNLDSDMVMCFLFIMASFGDVFLLNCIPLQ